MNSCLMRPVSKVWGFLVCLAFVGTSGCAMMKPAGQSELPLGEKTGQSNGTYTVEFSDVFSTSRVAYTGKIDGSNPTVQTALEQSGAWKRYRNLEVVTHRPVEGRYKPMPLISESQPGKRAIKFEQDYALHAGDRIVVSPKSSNPIAKLLEKAEQ